MARDSSTGAQEGLKVGVILIEAPEHGGDGMREIINTWALQSVFLEMVDRFSQLPTAIFEIGSGSAHHRDEALEKGGNGLASPAGGHRDADTTGTLKGR